MRTNRYLDWMHAGNGQGAWGAVFGAGFLALGYGVGSPGFPHTPWVIPAGGLAGFAIGKVIGWTLLEASGRTAQAVYMPNAAGTYAQTHSYIDALEARGDYAGAVAAWESIAVSQPGNAWPLLRAGELYARQLGEPQLAVERFRLARDVPGITPEHQRYVMQKLVDLYLGPLADEGRAMVELRRLVEHHAGTREADAARKAIARIKDARQDAP